MKNDKDRSGLAKDTPSELKVNKFPVLKISIIALVIFLILTVAYLVYTNIQLENDIANLKAATAEQGVAEKDSNGSLSDNSQPEHEVIRPKQVGSWQEVNSSYTFTKKVDYVFKYPETLIMKPSPRGFPNVYSFYATESDHLNHRDCINDTDSNADWEGGCNNHNLLFEVSIIEGDSPISSTVFYSDELYFLNINSVALITHKDIDLGFGGGGYKAITLEHEPNSRDWGIEIYIFWPTESARNKTEEIVDLESYELYKNILSTIQIQVDTKP